LLINTILKPTTIKQALASSNAREWQLAIDFEIKSLIQNQTWRITFLPVGRKPITSKWIFKVKHNVDGSINKYKAQLVAKGFTQVAGLDYIETFFPVLKLASIQLLLALAAQYNLKVQQMEIKTAFLNGHITEVIYMTIPDGMAIPPSCSSESLVCKLDKSLPALRQSSRAWYIRLYNYLIAHGFSTTKADPNIYVKRDSTHFILITIYVDDCIILSDTIPAILSLKYLLSVEFEMSDEGQIHYIFGLQIYRDKISQTLVLNQKKKLIITPCEISHG
jgi:hypothetical protein